MLCKLTPCTMYLLLKVPQPFVENGLQYQDPGLDWVGTHSLVRSCGLTCYQVAARMSPMKVTYREVIMLRTGVCSRLC